MKKLFLIYGFSHGGAGAYLITKKLADIAVVRNNGFK